MRSGWLGPRFRAWSGTRCTASATWRWIAATFGVLLRTTRRAWRSPGQANAAAGSCARQASHAPWSGWKISLAARVWGAVEAEERALGFRMLGDERKRYELWAHTLRGHLGDAAFVAADAEGAALTIDEALRQAMRHTGTIPIRRRRVDGSVLEAPIPANQDPPGSSSRANTGESRTRRELNCFATATRFACSRTCLRTRDVRTRLLISNVSAHHEMIRRPMRSRRAMRGSCSMRRHAGHTAPG